MHPGAFTLALNQEAESTVAGLGSPWLKTFIYILLLVTVLLIDNQHFILEYLFILENEVQQFQI